MRRRGGEEQWRRRVNGTKEESRQGTHTDVPEAKNSKLTWYKHNWGRVFYESWRKEAILHHLIWILGNILCLAICLTVIYLVVVSVDYTYYYHKNNGGQIEFTRDHEDTDLSDIKVGDTVIFGQYEQDDNDDNGKEDLEWDVLDIVDDKALLITKYVIDAKGYNEGYEDEDVTWETCDLRYWTNMEFPVETFLVLW